jgi:hypothetical protein
MTSLKTEANQDAEPEAYRVTLLYGDFGKRKTTTAASMVNERGMLISSDGSWEVLLNSRHSELLSKIKIIPYLGLSQLDYIDYDGYDTIILDTYSAMVDSYLDLLYEEADWGRDATGKARYRDFIITKNPELKNLSTIAPVDYGVTRNSFRPSLRKLFKLPAHLVFTSQLNNPVKGLTPDMTFRPSIPHATLKIVAERASIIGYLTAENKRFRIGVDEASLAYLGKSRIQGIQGTMDLDEFVKTYKRVVFK